MKPKYKIKYYSYLSTLSDLFYIAVNETLGKTQMTADKGGWVYDNDCDWMIKDALPCSSREAVDVNGNKPVWE